MGSNFGEDIPLGRLPRKDILVLLCVRKRGDPLLRFDEFLLEVGFFRLQTLNLFAPIIELARD